MFEIIYNRLNLRQKFKKTTKTTTTKKCYIKIAISISKNKIYSFSNCKVKKIN